MFLRCCEIDLLYSAQRPLPFSFIPTLPFQYLHGLEIRRTWWQSPAPSTNSRTKGLGSLVWADAQPPSHITAVRSVLVNCDILTPSPRPLRPPASGRVWKSSSTPTSLRSAAPADAPLPPSVPPLPSWNVYIVAPPGALFHVQIYLLHDELPLLVLLAGLVRPPVSPPDHDIAPTAPNVAHAVHPRDQESILGGTDGHVDAPLEQVGPAPAAVEGLGDDVVVTGEVCAAGGAAVDVRAVEIDHGIVGGAGGPGPGAEEGGALAGGAALLVR
mmetsp:Transcript_19110/g.55549  ORF Transcript_19110/g.55549 Transcript_19110/m.55549 type:complete len:271 (+) Transcript_19110:220-1032(+)